MRRLFVVSVSVVAALACAAGPQPAPEPRPVAAPPVPDPPDAAQPRDGAVKREWEALLASGCDLDGAEIETPFEARILRNAPYALAGRSFDTAALGAFFEADGGWYAPSGQGVELSGPALDCVGRLRTKETELQRTTPMSQGLMDRLLLDPAVYHVLRSWSGVDGPSYARPVEERLPEGGYLWSAGYPGCVDQPEEGIECGGYGIRCEGAAEPCTTVAAG